MPDDVGEARLGEFRRVVISLVIAFFVLAPALGALRNHELAAAHKWFLVAGSLVFVGTAWVILNRRADPGTGPVPWIPLALIVALGIALFVVGTENWLTALVVAAGVCGRFSATPRPALLASLACGIAGLAVAVADGFPFGNTVAVVLVVPLCAFFAYSAAKRIEMVAALRRTRAELARAAVAEERLRIARDLHDLLGHSLSLITLKAELAGRVVTADPDRAAREIGELETVARKSLSDVREAVAGFRQPDLAGELVAARQLLDAAGITSKISSAGTAALPQAVDAALAWAVREGTTNVVRHSLATQVTIAVSTGPAAATAEISDNGPAAPGDTGHSVSPALPVVPTAGPDGRTALVRARPAFAGSGLAGLAERVRSLGGELAAGAVEPQGFLLRVVVPLAPPA